ncbi:hypothetical protein OAR80_04220 [Methylophilaceae bacterium]|nr:hypothetical protein [bacterium]MDC0931931.1 hypothetical protein [Methylophilaceae bacterium]
MSAYNQKELEQWKNGLLGKQGGGSKKILLVALILVVVVVAYLYLSKQLT